MYIVNVHLTDSTRTWIVWISQANGHCLNAAKVQRTERIDEDGIIAHLNEYANHPSATHSARGNLSIVV